MGIVQGASGKDLGGNFCKPPKRLPGINATFANVKLSTCICGISIRSTFATQVSEAHEVGEEMEINLWGAMSEVGTWTKETLSSSPLPKVQTDSNSMVKL